MARHLNVDDSEWTEVKFINGYALFMGYLMMGVRGLGLLVITWTTVVLLGGFVSDLGKKDFWCLTGIMLIQTAGVVNFLLMEKLSDIVHLWWGLLAGAVSTFIRKKGKEDEEHDHDWDEDIPITKHVLLAFAATVIQGAVLFVVLCPVGVLYVFGIYISAGASLWRLMKHDFGNDGGANMKPALQVLYSLAVAQGVLFGYKTIYAFAAKNGPSKLTYLLDIEVPEALVEKYIEDTVAGCEKDSSFATGRNFVTYGVNLMVEAESDEGFIAGIMVLGGAINCSGQSRKELAKYLLTRFDSMSAIIQSLLEAVGPRSQYRREIKEHVVRILDIIAPCIRLEQFPRAIECLCCVADTSGRVGLLEEYVGFPDCSYLIQHCFLGNRKTVETVENEIGENARWGFDRLLIKAMNIIHKLVAAEDNRWIMRSCVSNSVLHKIAMLPTKLHRENHFPRPWYEKSELQMLEQCWVLTEWLLVAMTETSSPPVGEGRQRRRRGEIEEVEVGKGEEQLLLLQSMDKRSEEIEEVEVGKGEEQLLLQSMDGRSEEIEEVVGKGEEELLLLRSMDSSAFGSTIKHTIKHSIERTIKSIVDCLLCGATQKRQVIEILLHLSLDMSFIVNDSESSKRRLSWVLLLIFCSTDDDSKYWMVPSLIYRNRVNFDGIRRKAGEKLSEIMLGQKHDQPSEESARALLQSIQLAHEDLKSAFYSEDDSIRQHASIIKEDLTRRDYGNRLSELKGSLVDAVPKVVTEKSISCGSLTAESQEPPATDLEMGNGSKDIQDGSLDIE